ncbi:hypothetical protein K493DRAFT_358621 [Basidiobolus meristosporus CBS 931.73]|uniref:SPT2-domain-containing protein n=1 Tax=Basidiobolus meristosporus CBS 931.73 TaxID=1314790 RepID=A0A1Y1XTN4_9FUNG|nr:hypothetical protein K493DRAFT_358621 [Basidiobolus meristosporus CBS 931.73]|eukprot:ORX89129.1 hypothetical protein K493DRAFT_358621 [Basidiobolus meristosporus CBS 931.73]
MGEFEELMRLAAQHTREVDKELERKKKRQQLEEERRKKGEERRRQEEKASSAAQLAERRKNDLKLEREREERRREKERELLREKLKKDNAREKEAKPAPYKRETLLPQPKQKKQIGAVLVDLKSIDSRANASIPNRDARLDLSSRYTQSPISRDGKRSTSEPSTAIKGAKTPPIPKYSNDKPRRRSLSPPGRSRKRASSPRRPSSRKSIDESDFNEDYVKQNNISSIIGQLFGYDRSRYANERYSDDDMEASISDLRKEESRSAKIARLEDEREEELERLEQERLRARKKARLGMDKKKSPR